MAFPSVTEAGLHVGTSLPLQAGILALPITFQEPRRLCTSLLQYSIFKPLPQMLHLAGWNATISCDFTFNRGRFSNLTPQDLTLALISITDRSCTSYLHDQLLDRLMVLYHYLPLIHLHILLYHVPHDQKLITETPGQPQSLKRLYLPERELSLQT